MEDSKSLATPETAWTAGSAESADPSADQWRARIGSRINGFFPGPLKNHNKKMRVAVSMKMWE